ncbi:MAG: hypothetical protein M3N57_04740 [Actinomycetota bacterium]|nr:hypothetical protein [Actinomycetota bacterium]
MLVAAAATVVVALAVLATVTWLLVRRVKGLAATLRQQRAALEPGMILVGREAQAAHSALTQPRAWPPPADGHVAPTSRPPYGPPTPGSR